MQIMQWLKQAGTIAALILGAASVWPVCGCGGDAGLELAAGDALLAVADQMQLTVAEYHDEVSQYDDSRESSVLAAFVVRVQSDHDDEAAMETHVADFEAAMRKIRTDREQEWHRRTAAMDNVGVLREVAGGLQKLALESMSLQDEMRRYLQSWIETRRSSGSNGGSGTSATSATAGS